MSGKPQISRLVTQTTGGMDVTLITKHGAINDTYIHIVRLKMLLGCLRLLLLSILYWSILISHRLHLFIICCVSLSFCPFRAVHFAFALTALHIFFFLFCVCYLILTLALLSDMIMDYLMLPLSAH